MSVVLGVDPSLTVTGVALVEWREGYAEPSWSTWRGRAVKPENSTVRASRRRARLMLTEILALVPERLDLSVIEGPSMRSRHAGLADERSGLRWMLVDQLMARGPVVLVSPKTRAKLATGNGNADKKQVLAAMRAALPGVRIPDDNVADGAALAVAGAHFLGLPAGYVPEQDSAYAKVASLIESELTLAGMGL